MITAGADIFTQSKTASSWQKQCLEKFLLTGLPDKNSEHFHYFPTLKFKEYCENIEAASQVLSKEEVTQLLQRKRTSLRCVFLDVIFNKEFSSIEELPSKAKIMTFEEALETSYGSFLEQRQKMLLKEETDPLALLNGACSQGGIFIYIPPKMQMTLPLELMFLQADPFTLHVTPRVHILIGAESQVELVTFSEGGALFNGYLDIALEEKASLIHTTYSGEKQEDFGFFNVRAFLKKESVFRSILCRSSVRCRRENYKVCLLGEKAKAELLGLTILKNTEHCHLKMQVEHRAPECISEQKFKQVLSGQSRSSFTGTIFVEECAQQTQAYQMSRSLLLTEGAIAYAKPNLEIFADDVKASHGATIAQIDEEQRLYLQSRGIPFATAGALLTQGFCREIIDEISMDWVRDLCEEKYKQSVMQDV